MASWEEFVSGAKKTFNKAANKVNEMADNAADSIKIESLKIKLAEKYEELGRVVYAEMKAEKADPSNVSDKVAEVDDLIAKIKTLKSKNESKKEAAEASEEKND